MRELTGIFFIFKVKSSLCQSNSRHGKTLIVSVDVSFLERKGDKTDTTLLNKYFMIKFTYHDSVSGVTKEYMYTITSKHSQHEGNVELKPKILGKPNS